MYITVDSKQIGLQSIFSSSDNMTRVCIYVCTTKETTEKMNVCEFISRDKKGLKTKIVSVKNVTV